MKKFTAADVAVFSPDLSPEDIAEVLGMLNEEPIPMVERWARENDDLVRSIVTPRKLGPNRLRNALRELNEWAEEQGLPIPFPPPEWPKRRAD